MTADTKNDIGFVQVKAVSLAVTDAPRAKHFYKETLGLPPESVRQMDMAFMVGDVILLLKPEEEWYGKPTKELNPRITLEVKDSYATEKNLLERGVTISDPVAVYGNNPIGAFLDSEGNKLWFCSEGKKGLAKRIKPLLMKLLKCWISANIRRKKFHHALGAFSQNLTKNKWPLRIDSGGHYFVF